jgi:hypothetical protein
MSSDSRADLESFLRKQGIYLTISSSGPINIGDIFKGNGDTIDLTPGDTLEQIIKPKQRIPTPVFEFSKDRTIGFKTFDHDGIIKRLTNTNMAIEF